MGKETKVKKVKGEVNRRELLTAGVAAASTASIGALAMRPARAATNWTMVTTWPTNFPLLGTGAAELARLIGVMSNGELNVKIYGAGELVPAFETFDAVSSGSVQMGHSASYYWVGKAPAAQFFTSVPFGLTAPENTGWILYGGGQELWDEVYAPHDLKPFAAGNTDTQMAGWFREPVNSLADLQGLVMRMPGLGGEVIQEIGMIPKTLPGGEIFPAMQAGTIDATEWVGPYSDLAFGLYQVAKYYYWPGWHEPGSTLECLVNRQEYEKLPNQLKEVVKAACQAANDKMLAEVTAKNADSLDILIKKHGVKLGKLPEDVLAAAAEASKGVVAALGDRDALSKRVFDSYQGYRSKVIGSTATGMQGFMNAREFTV